jgi:hypothetical protein
MFNMGWGTKYRQTVEDIDQVVHLLKGIETDACVANEPIFVEISNGGVTAFGITVGGDLSYTQFYDSSRRPPIATSLDIVDSDELIEFDTMGELSQMERRYWIPIELAKRALRYYLETGQRFEEIKWTN